MVLSHKKFTNPLTKKQFWLSIEETHPEAQLPVLGTVGRTVGRVCPVRSTSHIDMVWSCVPQLILFHSPWSVMFTTTHPPAPMAAVADNKTIKIDTTTICYRFWMNEWLMKRHVSKHQSKLKELEFRGAQNPTKISFLKGVARWPGARFEPAIFWLQSRRFNLLATELGQAWWPRG